MEYKKTKEGYNLYPKDEDEKKVIIDFLIRIGLEPEKKQ